MLMLTKTYLRKTSLLEKQVLLCLCGLLFLFGSVLAGCGTAANVGGENKIGREYPPSFDGGAGDISSADGLPQDSFSSSIPKVGASIQAGHCPGTDKVFVGSQPCAADKKDCALGRLPAKLPVGNEKPTTDLEGCDKPDTVCVGPNQKVKLLQDAAVLVGKDKKITTILIAAGVYSERVVFSNIQQKLVIVGAAQNPDAGTKIVAPQNDEKIVLYAALSFINCADVSLRKMVLSGDGHGLYAYKSKRIEISNVTFQRNRGSGALLLKAVSATIRLSRFFKNGDPIAVNINHDHRIIDGSQISVNINHDHRPVTTSQIAVNINHDHRVVQGGQIAVNINHDHRVFEEHGVQFDRSQFGLVVGAADVVVENNVFEKNVAGGVRVVPNNDIAVNINHDHRVLQSDQIAVNINHDHKVALRGNSFSNNGPVSYSRGSISSGCGTCAPGSFCEGKVCHPRLSLAYPNSGGTRGLLGVGASISGIGLVEVSNNSFFRNDAAGLVVHSANTVKIDGNSVERNGVRPESTDKTSIEFTLPAIAVWNVRKGVDVIGNLVSSNISTGIRISHLAIPGASARLAINASKNHIAGNGHFLPEGVARGDGLSFVTEDTKGISLNLNVEENYFTANRRSGLSSVGAIHGKILLNLFKSHPARAVVLQQLGVKQDNILLLKHNTIDDAFGYGLQIYGDTIPAQCDTSARVCGSDAKITLEANLIQHVHSMGTDRVDALSEADGINIQNMDVNGVTVIQNVLDHNKRSGIFIHASVAVVKDNKISDCVYGMLLQHNARLGRGSQGYADFTSSKEQNPDMNNSGDMRNPDVPGGTRYNQKNWSCRKDF